MFSATAFAPSLFGELLGAAQRAGYAFARFDAVPASGKVFFMRHDVDISPAGARLLGRLAHEQGAVSNFFFQLNAETYTILSDEVLGIMRELQRQGHCVGLHIDQQRFGEDERTIARTIEWFSSCVMPVDAVVSFHRPAPSVVGKGYAAFVNAYDPRFFNPDCYLSDSRRSLAFLPKLGQWIAAGRPLIQLLLHPEWWCGIDDDLGVWTELRERRTHELAHYVTTNFAKVFDHVVAAETRDFRI